METGELACEERATRPKGQNMRCGEVAACPQFCTDRRRRRWRWRSNRLELKARVFGGGAKLASSSSSRTPRELDGKHVILKDIQRTPVSGENPARDLTRWYLNRAIRVEVPLKFIGQPGRASPTVESWRRSRRTARWNVCR